MEKNLLIVTSFGTTHEETGDKNIGAVEKALAAAFPDWAVRRAFTSGMIRRALQKRGVEVDDLPAALARAKAEGFGAVAMQPTHLLYGEEYDKLAAQAAESEEYEDIPVGKPLLAETADLQGVAAALAEEFPARPGRCTVLMGHGTTHYVNPVYAAMEYYFRALGREDIVLGTVEAYPGIDEVLGRVAAGGWKQADLAPLMLVAGDHAANDMASDDEDSWKSRLEAAGVEVFPHLRGLGELAAVRDIYTRHAGELLDSVAAR